jgi:small subunit ribosomal protein S4
MARYTDAVCRLCRRYGDKLMLKGERCMGPKCAMERRPMPPGQRPARRRRISDRALQLREKQKARFVYGVMERQFRRYYREAIRRSGVTGENLLRLLETRLDNVVYRMGFAESRSQARQLVCHGHLVLNGRKTDIPSCAVKVGDVVGWVSSRANTEYYKIAKEAMAGKYIPEWLSVDASQMTGRVVAVPALAEMEAKFDPAVIVEFYSR